MASSGFATVVSTKKLESILVEPVVAKRIPDHLADTKVFTKLSSNEVFHMKPATLHYEGFYVGQSQKKTLQITNVSRDNQRLHIIPPATSIFSIHYVKQKNTLAPGFHLDVTVEFKPKEWKYYYDCIRIHCKGRENLYVPLHAYPTMNTRGFPKSVTFPATPIGESSKRLLTLCCDVPVDFEYQLTYIQPHPSFHVSPVQELVCLPHCIGVVPAHGKTRIAVRFTPTEFSTAIMKLQLKTSQFNSNPIECTFIGYSTPGLAASKARENAPISLPPLEKLKEKKKQSKLLKKIKQEEESKLTTKEVIYKGIRFPNNINTPNSVAKVLNQQAGKLKASELKTTVASSGAIGSRQCKEAAFLQEVRTTAEEERANQLRWVTHLGLHLMSDLEKQSVVAERSQSGVTYQHYRRVPVVEAECSRTTTECNTGRTFRDTNQKQDVDTYPKFQHYSSNNWAQRHMVQQRFVQAVRKVIITQRCSKRLVFLKAFIDDWKKGKFVATGKQSTTEDVNTDDQSFSMTTNLILPSSFPVYQADKNDKDKFSKGVLSLKPLSASTVISVKLMDLRVPEQSKLLCYEQQGLPTKGVFISSEIPRDLRQGAKEEIASLESCIEITDEAVMAADHEEETHNLSPPKALFLPSPNHPLHILGCGTDAVGCVPPLPHHETDIYHAFQSIPKYATDNSRKKFDHQDVIPGVMKWKQFPSVFLSSLEASKTLSTAWVPRWCQPYTLLREQAPNLMTGPSPNDYYDSSEISHVPTPSTIKAQFFIPNCSNDEDSRSLAEKQIRCDNQEHFNQFGRQVNERLQQMSSLLTHTQLPPSE